MRNCMQKRCSRFAWTEEEETRHWYQPAGQPLAWRPFGCAKIRGDFFQCSTESIGVTRFLPGGRRSPAEGLALTGLETAAF